MTCNACDNCLAVREAGNELLVELEKRLSPEQLKRVIGPCDRLFTEIAQPCTSPSSDATPSLPSDPDGKEYGLSKAQLDELHESYMKAKQHPTAPSLYEAAKELHEYIVTIEADPGLIDFDLYLETALDNHKAEVAAIEDVIKEARSYQTNDRGEPTGLKGALDAYYKAVKGGK